MIMMQGLRDADCFAESYNGEAVINIARVET